MATPLEVVEDILEIIQGDPTDTTKPGLVKRIQDYVDAVGGGEETAKLNALIFEIVNVCIGVVRAALAAAKPPPVTSGESL